MGKALIYIGYRIQLIMSGPICFRLILFDPIRPFLSLLIITLDHIKSHYDLRCIKSTQYGEGMCSFATNMHKFVRG